MTMSHPGNDYLNDKAYEIAQVLIQEMFDEHQIDHVLNNLEMSLDICNLPERRFLWMVMALSCRFLHIQHTST